MRLTLIILKLLEQHTKTKKQKIHKETEVFTVQHFQFDISGSQKSSFM